MSTAFSDLFAVKSFEKKTKAALCVQYKQNCITGYKMELDTETENKSG